MFDPILNFSYSLVATAPSPADTGNTLQISNVDKDLFPDPSTDGAYNATVWVSGEIPKISNATIIRITGKSVGATYTTLTFTRTQEGSNNRDILVGDQIMVSVTKKRFDDITTEIITSRNLSAGCATSPTYTDNGSGNITVNAVTVRMFSTSDFTGYLNSYSLSPITVTLTDGVTNYVVADYNSGTPILKVITDVSLINESNVIPVFTIIRTGSVLHSLDWDRLGLGLSNKLHQRLVKTERFTRESGLSLSETGTRNLILTSGVVWYGATQKSLSQITTATDKIVFYYHSSGNWVSDFTGTQYNNTQYDNGTNLATLTTNRYAVNWLFRGVEDQKHLYMILGSGDYTLTQAQAAVLPSIPPIISAHAILVAKLIVQKSAATATSIQSAFDITFSSATPSNHNDLIGLQGGTTNEYYHLTSAQYNSVVSGQNSFITRELVNETPNGTTTVFTVDNTPVSGSEEVYLNGQLQNVGASNDYTISGSTITFNTAPQTGDIILVCYQYSTSTSGNADTLDGFHANSTPTSNNIPVLDSNAKLPLSAYNPIHNLSAPILINGKIDVSVTSNNITIAIKGMDGNNPSSTNPVYIRLGNTIRTITSALSVTKNAGTNWFNSGGAELATNEVDYFVYLGYNATDGIIIGFARIPWGEQYSSFSTTSTDDRYCAISTITNATANDPYFVIGRFAATLSAGSGYTWSVPTFTNINLIQRPIFNTRSLVFTPQCSSVTMTYTVVTRELQQYQINMHNIKIDMSIVGTTSGTAASLLTFTIPFTLLDTATYHNSLNGWTYDTNFGQIVCFNYGSRNFQFQKNDNSNFGIGTGRRININGSLII